MNEASVVDDFSNDLNEAKDCYVGRSSSEEALAFIMRRLFTVREAISRIVGGELALWHIAPSKPSTLSDPLDLHILIMIRFNGRLTWIRSRGKDPPVVSVISPRFFITIIGIVDPLRTSLKITARLVFAGAELISTFFAQRITFALDACWCVSFLKGEAFWRRAKTNVTCE